MSAYAELSAFVRQPLRAWWVKTGMWWLIGVTVARLIFQAWGVYVAMQPDGYHWPSLPGLVVGDILGLVGLLGTPLVWLLAALAVIRCVDSLPAEESRLSQAARSAQTLFALCLSQGLWPLLAACGCVVAINCGTEYWLHPQTFSGSNFLQALDTAGHSLVLFLPVWLVACGLLALTHRPQLSVGLVVVQMLAAAAWERINVVVHAPGQPSMWLVLFEIAISAAALCALLYGLMVGKTSVWRTAYWTLLVSLPLSPALFVLYSRYPGWPLSATYASVNAISYLLFSHRYVGNWLSQQFEAHVPVEPTVLGLASPLILDLWYVVLCVGLFVLLYWMLGKPWEKSDPGEAKLPDPSPAVA